MTTNYPTIAAPDAKALFDKPAALVAQEGLRNAGGTLLLESSLPEVQRRPTTTPTAVAGGFVGNWAPTKVDDSTINLTEGVLTMDGEDFFPEVEGITVDSGDLNYVYLKATLVPTFEDGYVTGGGCGGVEIVAATEGQVSDDSTGYILLCTWQAGALVERFRWFSLSAELTNKGSAGTVAFNFWTA